MTTFVLIHGANQGGWIWQPTAARLRLGRGYFVRLSKAAAITKTGTAAPTSQPYNLALNAGWDDELLAKELAELEDEGF